MLAQEATNNGFKTEYINEVNVSKEVLYTRLLLWFSSSQNDVKKECTLQSKESGTLVGKIEFPLPVRFEVNDYLKETVRCNLKIDCRENKYRLTFTDAEYISKQNLQSNPKYMSTESIKIAKKQFEAVVDISKSLFNNSTTWQLNILEKERDYHTKNLRSDKTNENSFFLINHIVTETYKKLYEIKQRINENVTIVDDF